MVFNTLTPVDSDPAMDIDIYIRDLKESVAERLRCTNSDGVDEHQDGDDIGIHEPSLVSFVQIFDTVLEYESAPKIESGLYYVRANQTLYAFDEPLATADHSNLEGRLDVDAHDFYHIGNVTRDHQVDLTLEGGFTFNFETSSGGALIGDWHSNALWFNAHGPGSFDTAWIQPRVLSGLPTTADVDGTGKRTRIWESVASGDHRFVFLDPNQFYFMPLVRMRHSASGSSIGTYITFPDSGAVRIRWRNVADADAADCKMVRLSNSWV